MANLTGIKNAEYLAQFLGGKIIIRQDEKLYLYPILTAIYAWNQVEVEDSNRIRYKFGWKQCENPYLILTDHRLTWEQK